MRRWFNAPQPNPNSQKRSIYNTNSPSHERHKISGQRVTLSPRDQGNGKENEERKKKRSLGPEPKKETLKGRHDHRLDRWCEMHGEQRLGFNTT